MRIFEESDLTKELIKMLEHLVTYKNTAWSQGHPSMKKAEELLEKIKTDKLDVCFVTRD
jgi:hypothetical protein